MDKKKILKKIKYSLRFLPDKLYLQMYYFAQFKKFINFKNPKTFNEKLNWLKINDRNPKYAKMVDKFDAKEYVASIIGEEYIIPTLGVWDKFDDIDFDKLPNQFVLKCTHDSDGLIIVKDKSKFNKKEAKEKIEEAMKYNFYYIGREWAYKNVSPRIIAEKYMGDNLNDYKIFCFNGKPEFTLVCSNRRGKFKNTDFYDNNWNLLPFTRKKHTNNKDGILKPSKINQMLSIASKLSENIPFVRVDLYLIENQIYFGELTFYPSGGFEGFNPSSWDEKLGNLIIK